MVEAVGSRVYRTPTRPWFPSSTALQSETQQVSPSDVFEFCYSLLPRFGMRSRVKVFFCDKLAHGFPVKVCVDVRLQVRRTVLAGAFK